MWDDWTETVTLRRVSTSGRTVHGDPVSTSSTEVPIEGALFAPNRGPGGELLVGQDTTDDSGIVLLPAGSPVPDPNDEMDVRGETWQVNGKPGEWPDGIEVFLRKTGRAA